jgi:hypothetical protein
LTLPNENFLRCGETRITVIILRLEKIHISYNSLTYDGGNSVSGFSILRLRSCNVAANTLRAFLSDHGGIVHLGSVFKELEYR